MYKILQIHIIIQSIDKKWSATDSTENKVLRLLHNYKQKNPQIKSVQLPYKIGIKEMVAEFSQLDNYYIVGIGNMVGWGENFIQELKGFRKNVWRHPSGYTQLQLV